MNWITIGLVVIAIFLVVSVARKEMFDSRKIDATHRLTPHTLDAPLQPVLRGSYSSGSWVPTPTYQKEYENNYHLEWLPDSITNR